MSKHIIHIRSSVPNKLPTSEQMVFGEIAVNYSAGNEKLAIRNTEDRIVTFPTQEYVDGQFGNLSGNVIGDITILSGIVGELSASTVNIENNLTIVSSNTVNIENNVNILSANTVDLEDDIKALSGVVRDFSGSVKERIDTVERVTSQALNDLNDRIIDLSGNTTDLKNDFDYFVNNGLDGLFCGATYDSNSKKINFYDKKNNLVCDIDATDFIKDGMVSSVTVNGQNLVITFNTDAGKEDISLPLTEIFNPDNYYTKLQVYNKDEIDAIIADITGSASGSSSSILVLSGHLVTLSSATVNIENNLKTLSSVTTTIINDVNNLSGSVLELSSVTVDIQNNLTILSGSVIELSASTVNIQNDLNNLSGNVIALSASTVNIENNLNLLSSSTVNIENNVNNLSGSVIELSSSTVNIENNLNALSGVVGDFSGSVINVIVANEKVASAAFNDLNNRIKNSSGKVNTLSGSVVDLSGKLNELSASTVNIENNVTNLSASTVAIESNLGELSASTVAIDTNVTNLSSSTVAIENNLGELSGVVTEFSGTVKEIIEQNEFVVSCALNDLNDRIITVSGTTNQLNINVMNLSSNTVNEFNNVWDMIDTLSGRTVDLSGYYTSGQTNAQISGYTYSTSQADDTFVKKTKIIETVAEFNDLDIDNPPANSANTLVNAYVVKKVLEDYQLVVAQQVNHLANLLSATTI